MGRLCSRRDGCPVHKERVRPYGQVRILRWNTYRYETRVTEGVSFPTYFLKKRWAGDKLLLEGGESLLLLREARPLRVRSQRAGRCVPNLIEYCFDNFALARNRAFLHASDIVHSVRTTKIKVN
jgi:hypothetical protein